MILLCCEATAVLPQTHWQCQVVEVVEEGGGWKHQGRAPQRVGRWWHPGRRERKNSKTACFHSHSICTLDIARMVCKQLSVVVRPLKHEGLSQTDLHNSTSILQEKCDNYTTPTLWSMSTG